MKHKITVTIEADVIQWVEAEAAKGRFRNRSHGFEYCAILARNNEAG